jgi:hypothetical protein
MRRDLIGMGLFLSIASLVLLNGRAEGRGPGVVSPSTIERFQSALATAGFAVEEWEGSFGNVDVGNLVCKGLMASGFGNNADAPYMIFNTEVEIPALGRVKIPRLFQLQPDEAVVFIGKTPPPVAYFSYRSYVIDHIYEDASGAQEAKRVFTSLGDTLSNRTIKTERSHPFQADVLIVITADRETDRRVRAAAREAGIPAAIINTDIIPSSVVRMGVDKEPMPFQGPPKDSDAFVFIHRVFLNEGDESAYQHYLDDPGARVFHLTHDAQAVKHDPFPMPKVLKRGSGSTEVDLMPSLENLRQAILHRYPGYTATELTTGIWLEEWLDGIQRGKNLLGENRDTSYLSSENFRLRESPDEFLVVYGLNHELLGKATYSNFGVYHDLKKLGIVGKHSRDLAGSASEYLPADPEAPFYDPNASYLYAQKVSRVCNDPKCLQVKLPSRVLPCEPVDLNEDLFVAFRAYLEPSTGVGPFWYELLYDRVIKFSRRP